MDAAEIQFFELCGQGMRYKAKETNLEDAAIHKPLKAVIEGLGFCLIEMAVSRHRGSVQVRVVIYSGMSIGTDDCSKIHRAIMPRLELAFPQQEIYLEVSSAGIDRSIKDGEEFVHYKGKGVRCYRTDISNWTAGILESVDENGIILITKEEPESQMKLSFDIIAKARLDSTLS